MKVVIFLGPSLPVTEARQIVDAIYLPPAAQSDLLSAAMELQPDVIGLVDGVFLQSLSVWHKEILFALKRGIRVYGSSSMGALRAAETDAFGMIGVGQVYRMYASGELMDDDEVALSHGSRDQGYKPLSLPMVNVRATLQSAHQAGLITVSQCDELISMAKKIYFAQRSLASLRQAARESGMPENALEPLFDFINSNFVDLKRQDTLELLRTIAALVSSPPAASPSPETSAFEFHSSIFFQGLFNRDRRVRRGGVEIALESVANQVAIYDPNFEQLNWNALNRGLAVEFARHLGLTPEAEDISAASARLKARFGLDTSKRLTAWFEDNNISEPEFHELVEQVALCHRLQRWYMTRHFFHRTTSLILDELRLTGEYPKWANQGVEHEKLLSSPEGESALAAVHQLPSMTLGLNHQRRTGWSPGTDVEGWSEQAGFHNVGNLRGELARAQAVEVCLQKAKHQERKS